MVKLPELVAYLTHLLEPQVFKDYCPNGLQVEGKQEITTLVTGVTASQALIDAAVEKNADAILVHHGLFWKGEAMTLTGMKYRRVKSLIVNKTNLLAYHLPLDAHPLYGNNAQLAKILNIDLQETFEVEPGIKLGCLGEISPAQSVDHFTQHLESRLQRVPLHIPSTKKEIRRIAWCTGAAQDFILPAIDQGIDAYLTGEVSERTVHIARENNIHFFAAGHHATERYGVLALGEHLSERFGLAHSFIDIDNPV